MYMLEIFSPFLPLSLTLSLYSIFKNPFPFPFYLPFKNIGKSINLLLYSCWRKKVLLLKIMKIFIQISILLITFKHHPFPVV